MRASKSYFKGGFGDVDARKGSSDPDWRTLGSSNEEEKFGGQNRRYDFFEELCGKRWQVMA
jgi:hypothetical protein